MTQPASDAPNQATPPISQPLPDQPRHFSKAGISFLLVPIGFALLLLTGLVVYSFPQIIHQAPQRSLAPTATHAQDGTVIPIAPANNKAVTPLALPGGQSIIYEQQNKLYMLPSTGGLPQLIATPGYIYNAAIRPIVTSSGQLLYAGNGVWLTDIFTGKSTQVAALAANVMLTSMALSGDGTVIAWSTEPADGAGNADIYAGPLTAPTLVYEHADADCPCFRLFSFMSGAGNQGDTTLLLTDDQGSLEGVQYGLWTLALTPTAKDAEPAPLLDEDSLQGPLAFAPSGNTLLYSPNEGVVPNPTDGSVPAASASLTYADSLSVATLDGSVLRLGKSQVVLPEQHNLSNNADYHWVTTPLFSPDGHTLIYVEFSSDSQAPFDRHSALYTVQVTGAGTQSDGKTDRPHLLATSTALLIELGPWLNDHVITFYADGTLYALDIRSGAVATVLQTAAYARIIAVVGK